MSARTRTTGPGSIAHHPDDAGPADALGHLDPADGAKLLGHDRGRAGFLERQFRVLVEIDEQGFKLAVVIGLDRGREAAAA